MAQLDVDFLSALALEGEPNYVLRKSSEECMELGLVLLQQYNKPTKNLTTSIIEEAGHVMLRLKQLEARYGAEAIMQQAIKKQEYLRRLRESGRYMNV